MMKTVPSHPCCPVDTTLEIIGGKWKPLILFYLINEPIRFNELKRRIPLITQRMLTLQLRDLEQANIVQRTVYEQVPPKVDYRLTTLGETLIPIIQAMYDWGQMYREWLTKQTSLSKD